jgi:hypothetical protein
MWSPFQSAQVREIVAHMSDDEYQTVSLVLGSFGIWNAGMLAVPLTFGIANGHYVVAVVFVTIWTAAVPAWLRKIRRSLCETEWAKQRRWRADTLRLYSLSLSKRHGEEESAE